MITSFEPISFSSSSRRLRRRAITARRTPSLASVVAMARPMPMLAPVTSAVRPRNWSSMAPDFTSEGPCLAPVELKDVHAGVGAVDDVDEAAVVHLEVIRLDRHLAAVSRGGLHAALVGLRGRGGDVVARLARMVRAADV